MDMIKILQEAIERFPIGTKFISCMGSEDIIRSLPRICTTDNTEISVDCQSQNGRLIYSKKTWAKIISSPQKQELVINNYSIF